MIFEKIYVKIFEKGRKIPEEKSVSLLIVQFGSPATADFAGNWKICEEIKLYLCETVFETAKNKKNGF